MNAIRSVRAPPAAVFTPSLQTSLSRRKGTLISFRPITTTRCSKQPESSMDRKDENPKEKPGDVMSDSFGEGYATRSDEEGFGGIYGGNDKKTEENHPGPGPGPDYDKTQGSEVKEKEKGRHQTHVPN